ncbi:hypothetical protein ACFC06_16345 [Nocardia sp. NPDC056064]|uniref:restriction system modified-DNA reader domain-containing protein n=1 Tax=Nocardia sp. NPDC056064 TaxID=3345701 RepID=UPI0035D9DE81
MKMHEIHIDDEVYSALVDLREGFEQPNDVLRRLLLDRMPRPGSMKSYALGAGRLSPLIAAGLIEVGDRLRHERVRKGQVFTGVVTEGGGISTEHGVYAAPSRALKDLVGTEIDGWHYWTHIPSGKSLRELRGEL